MRNKKRSNPNFATEEKVMKALLIIALPIILSNILQGVLEIVDMHFIGALGNDAISGCGIASSVLMVLMVVNFGVNTATAAFASRAYGSKNYERVKVIMMHSLYMVLIFSAVIAFIGMFFSKNIMYLMGADEAVAVQGALFLRPLLMGVCVMVVLMILVTVFQSTGDSRTPMIVMIFVNIVNIILNPTFIHTLGFGVSGSAYATIASRSFGILMMLFAMYVVKKDSPVKFPRKLTFEPHLLKDVVIVAIPAAIQSGIRSASLLLMTAVITYAYGTIAMAAFGICGRLDMLGFMIVMGICTGVSVMVGQNLGASKVDRAEQAVRYAVLVNITFMIIVSCIYIIFSSDILAFFGAEAETLSIGISFMNVVPLSFFVMGAGMTLGFAMSGAGMTRPGMYSALAGQMCVQVGLSAIFAFNGLPIQFVWYAIAAGAVVTFISNFLLYKNCGWRTYKLNIGNSDA